MIVAGPVGSGKTTILTSLFESFLEAPTGNYLFAGSKTLVGFERRCHDARKASGRLVAETGHTSRREGVRFLHLKLAAAEADIPSPRHLLLSDVSGELFKTLRDSNSAVKEMTALQRADHLCVVIDGQKLTELGQRQVARNDARSMLRSIIAMGVLSPTCKIEIVFSKWDLILSAQPTQDLHRFLAETRGHEAVRLDTDLLCESAASRYSRRKISTLGA